MQLQRQLQPFVSKFLELAMLLTLTGSMTATWQTPDSSGKHAAMRPSHVRCLLEFPALYIMLQWQLCNSQ